MSGQAARMSASARSGAANERKATKQPGKAGIDQARPMGVVAGRRVEADLVQIEPAAAGEEVAHLDEPHGVVAVEQALAHLGPPLGEQNARGRRPCHDEQGREGEPTA